MQKGKNRDGILSYLSAPEMARPYNAWKNLVVIIGTIVLSTLASNLTSSLLPEWISENPLDSEYIATPSGLVAILETVLLQGAIPITAIGCVIAGILRERPLRTVISAEGRFRPRLFLAGLSCLLAYVPLVMFEASLVMPNGIDWGEVLGKVPIANMIVTLALTCTSAAFEEVICRGYLSQSLYEATNRIQGKSGRKERMFSATIAAVLSAVLFSMWHADSGSVNAFLPRLVTGLVLSVMVNHTGGLEVALAAHAAYDLPIFVLDFVGTYNLNRLPMEVVLAIMAATFVSLAISLLLALTVARLTCGSIVHDRLAIIATVNMGNDGNSTDDGHAERHAHRSRIAISLGVALPLGVLLVSALFPIVSVSHFAYDEDPQSIQEIPEEDLVLYLTTPRISAKPDFSVGDHVIATQYDDLMFMRSEHGIVMAVPGETIEGRSEPLGDDEYLIGYGGDIEAGSFEDEVVVRYVESHRESGAGESWELTHKLVGEMWPEFRLF